MGRTDVPESQSRANETELLLRAATAAPSLHNSQPWQFAVTSDRVEVFADPSRQLRHADPAGRSLLISVGAALFNLRVAAEHLGFRPLVQLHPEPPVGEAAAPALVAVMTLGRRYPGTGELDALYAAIPARRTNRRPFRDQPVPPEAVAALEGAAAEEGAELRVLQDPHEVARITDLLHSADRLDERDVARPGERAAWIGGPGRDEGIPVRSLGPRPVDPQTAYRDLGAGVAAERGYATFEPAPTIGVLSTTHDEATDWLRSGQALQRLLLEATNAGLAASFTNQALEHEELRSLVQPVGEGHPQMILRLGYGDPVPPTPRRPTSAVRREPHGTP